MGYTIGLVDEEATQLRNIRFTIKTNATELEQLLEFKEYELEGSKNTLTALVTEKIVEDITSGAIDSLIIDYKIMINTAIVEGTDIYHDVHQLVPKFPLVMLTDVPANCYEKDFVDADKIYLKKEFYKIEGDYSKEKVKNILKNMERYSKSRAALSSKLEQQLNVLTQGDESLETYLEIASTERQLDEYCPLGQTQLEKNLDIAALREAVDLLSEAEEMLGAENGS
ncbi:hypothetical protein [Eggerthella guodeyinii]|uniref:Uncharacterized protein n=1 Tax=Eggerthella guodeyinii TaxID=2690837 RepID=A0A6N7RQ43_9ACTN|nr:hypothetical protein [Eggerthella guodeyinii]MRX82910.1 hypothetical protein [Eggerthella guodeyinii]